MHYIHGTNGLVYTQKDKAEAFADYLERDCRENTHTDEDEEEEEEIRRGARRKKKRRGGPNRPSLP